MLLNESKLDPRVRRTRQLLQDAFIELMREKSFQAITIQDIAALATVNRSTFYAHFEDKYDLLDAIIRDSFQKILDEHLAADATFSLDNLQTLTLATCEFLAQFYLQQCPPSTRQFKSLIEKEVQKQIFYIIFGWLTEFETVSDSPSQPELTASTISWAIFGAGLYWSRNQQSLSIENVSEWVLNLVTDGLNGRYAL